MDNDTKKLVQTEFLVFAMKAFAYLNKGSDLGQDKYLKLLAERLARVAAGKTKRLVVSLPPRHFKTFMGSICLPAVDPGAQPLRQNRHSDLWPGPR